MIQTLKEIRDNVAETARDSQIDSLIDSYVNLTLQEINDPAWAIDLVKPNKGFNHVWSFLRRKTTISATSEFSVLPRDVDKIGLIRQTDSPSKLRFVPDDLFYKMIPNPEATGNPFYYRLWEEEGISTRLAVADKIDIVSDSASDTSTITVSVVGYINGIRDSETYSLNGTTVVNGSKTFDANMPIFVSKSANTAGTITVTENSGGTTLVTLGPEERSPRFKVIGLYPIPSSTTLYIEYYGRIRNLVNDQDVSDVPPEWSWVVRNGALAKVYQYQGKESMFNTIQALYASGVRQMIASDNQNVDFIPRLTSHNPILNRSSVVVFDDYGYGVYGLNY